MIKLRCKKLFRSNSKVASTNAAATVGGGNAKIGGEIKWELRPGGMLVQKRECAENDGDSIITLRVSTVNQCHHISIQANSSFGMFPFIFGHFYHILKSQGGGLDQNRLKRFNNKVINQTSLEKCES